MAIFYYTLNCYKNVISMKILKCGVVPSAGAGIESRRLSGFKGTCALSD